MMRVLLLSILVLFQGVNNYFWLKQDNESLGTDVALHVNSAVSLRQGLKSILHSEASLPQKCRSVRFLFFDNQVYWPRFVHLIAALTSFLPGDPLFWIRFSNMFYFIILIISVYLLGKKIHSPPAGLLAACFISLYPGIFGLSRKFGLDFPLIAIVSLAMYFLISSDNFRNLRYSILFGLTSGLALLIKGQFVFFLAGPFLYVVCKGFMDKDGKKKSIRNILIIAFLALAIAMVWWYKMTSSMWGIYFRPTVASILPRFFILAYYHMSPLFFAAFLLGFSFYIAGRKMPPVFLLLWIIVPFLLFSVLVIANHERYIFPVFGATALISAAGLLRFPLRKARVALIAFFIFIGIAQFFMYSYIFESCRFFWMAHGPEQNNHRKVMDIFGRAMQEYKPGGSCIGIIEEDYLRADPAIRISYFLKLGSPENSVFLSADGYVTTYPSAYPTAKFRASEDFLANINNFDFIVAFSQDSRRPEFWKQRELSGNSEIDILLEAEKTFRDFKVVKRNILMPEEIYVFLLKRQ